VKVKCSVFIAASLDGFIARKNGAIDWLVDAADPNSTEDYGYKSFFDSVDALVMGRKTFEMVSSFNEWPYRGKPVIVLSSGSPSIPENLTESVEIHSGSPVEIVNTLVGRGMKHLYIDGGITIHGFLKANLIDEMTITRIPILLGDGIPLFGIMDKEIKLEHIQTITYPNGYVKSQYQVVRKGIVV
jgi:dihydrofolate reductase